MAFNTPYCDLACANVILSESDIWNSASQQEQELALSYGRAFLDMRFDCIEFDETDPPEAIKYANALAAEGYLAGTLIPEIGSVSGTVRREFVKAGDVESETEYFTSDTANMVDRLYPILQELCTLKSAGTANLTRV